MVNVWRKSRGNRFWFELARVQVIRSQLYFKQNSHPELQCLFGYHGQATRAAQKHLL